MSSIITKESVSACTEQKTTRLLGFRLNPENPRKVTAMEVSEEIWLELGRPICNHHKRMQKQGKCALKDVRMLWKCDADCELCDYRCNGRDLRLDQPVAGDEGDFSTEGDLIPSDGPAPDEVAVERSSMGILLERLEQLDPEAVVVGRRMLAENMSVSKALEKQGISRPGYRYHLAKAKRILCEEFGVEDIAELL